MKAIKLHCLSSSFCVAYLARPANVTPPSLLLGLVVYYTIGERELTPESKLSRVAAEAEELREGRTARRFPSFNSNHLTTITYI